MGLFLESEKLRLFNYKASSSYFTHVSKADGFYKSKPRSFCITLEYAEENLFDEIRTLAVSYFAKQEIKWHDGKEGKPSNHLCDSQVCCVNFLFPFADKPDALIELLRPVFPQIHKMVPIDGQFVTFEWIGQQNYLGERVSRNGKRIRGANFTSADAAVMFEDLDGLRQIVLIEWKYTESYSSSSLQFAASGTDRTKIYSPLYSRQDCPLNKTRIPDFNDLFYEPFYQLMRQQLLAHEMEKAKELGANVVSVLHIAPEHNHDFRRVTSPALRSIGSSVTDVWQELVVTSDRFVSVSTEKLFRGLPIDNFPKLLNWWRYITERYSWI